MEEQKQPMNAPDGKLAAQLKGVTREINEATKQRMLAPRHHNEGVPRFVDLTDKVWDAAIEAAKRQVLRAEKMLKQIEAESEEARARAKARWEEQQKLERDLEDMSSELLQTFNRYNGK